MLEECENRIKLNESVLSYPRCIASAMQCNSGRCEDGPTDSAGNQIPIKLPIFFLLVSVLILGVDKKKRPG